MQIPCNSVPFIDNRKICDSLVGNLEFAFQLFSLNPPAFTDRNENYTDHRHNHKWQMIQEQSVVIDESDDHRTNRRDKMYHVHRNESGLTPYDTHIKCNEYGKIHIAE